MLGRFDVGRIDGVRGVEWAAGGGLLDESVENIVNDVFVISEKPVNSAPGWRFIKSAVVLDKAVLELSCDWTSDIDILVVAV